MTTFVDTDLASIAGPVLTPADPAFADEVAGFNAAIRPSPSLVVGATTTGDVAAAVRFAARTGRRVAVQATGHGLVDALDGTVLVSTRRMAGVAIDRAERTARVQAGATWRQVIDAAAPHGLAPLNGSSSGVGVVGYTTGGGLGPMARRFGFAADHVRRFTIVTADGVARDVDERCDPDLFWAVRGGKANLGIVTGIEFGLLPVARFYGGGVFFAADAAAAVLHGWRAWAPTLPDDASTSVALLQLPPDPALPEPLRGRSVVHLRFCHLGTPDEGERLLAPMRALAPALLDAVAEMPYAAIDAVHMDPTTPMPVRDRGITLATLPTEAVDALLAQTGPDAGSPLTMVELRLLGGAIAREPLSPNAVSGRHAAFSVYALGVLAGPTATAVPQRADALAAALQPWAAGEGLVNLLGPADAELVARQWGSRDRDRLRRIARRYDPAGLFAANVPLPA
ncbi:FAD linked oxidase domain protein [Pseudonocardia dioxanivorans CB1190]|uniref:FAD linked oxidase domain protein n=1 Tax=Pseudonocardia dioxanivorans (strain ATCC 55486 / DSM 44775 / JCM 13855 / CB1190) TaxID=675635 RepID=F4CSJ6_PSEUX|nr:FAD-binding protein [Pseudonocardia dioxanivorans]AEA23706.1 FAD linked oxidase domain protein [Pseudonocardia dioxanivorans CB1190]